MDDDVNTMKAAQNLVDYLRRTFDGRDICLDKMVVRLLRRGGPCGDDDGCASKPEAVGNRLARALRAAGYQNSLAGKFFRVR